MVRKIKKPKKTELRRFIEYMISGGAYFWSGYLVFFFIDKGLGLAFFYAKSISTLVGWSVNYALQRYWVFKNPELAKHKTEVTTRYTIITLVNFVLDYLIVFWLKTIGITPYIGQFISSAFFTVWNYLWYKFWVFPDKFSKKTKRVKHGPARVLAHHAHGHAAYRIHTR
ncbi:MAG: GtrA family protein [Candidatus Saccharimonadales bacterium]